jgi:hypothetical protein
MNLLELPGIQSILAQLIKQAAPDLERVAMEIRDTIKAVDDRLTRIEQQLGVPHDDAGRRNQEAPRSLNGAGNQAGERADGGTSR